MNTKNGNELDALKRMLVHNDFIRTPFTEVKKDYDLIEKTLKAVVIVRTKMVNLTQLWGCLTDLEEYNKTKVPGHQLTKEESELIYEVFMEEISIDSWVAAMYELDDPDLPKNHN